MELNKRLKQLRTNQGMTQNDLAKRIGMSRATIANWERGMVEPDSEKLSLISNIFGVTVDYLLGNTDNPTPYDDSFEKSDDELRDFLEDKEITAMFKDYGSWTDEEKQAILAVLKGQKALRESKK